MKVKYVGMFESVSVPQLRSRRRVGRGETIDVPDELAASLLEQPDNWAATDEAVTDPDNPAEVRDDWGPAAPPAELEGDVEPVEADPDPDPFKGLTADELRAAAAERGLDESGTKAELLERLRSAS